MLHRRGQGPWDGAYGFSWLLLMPAPTLVFSRDSKSQGQPPRQPAKGPTGPHGPEPQFAPSAAVDLLFSGLGLLEHNWKYRTGGFPVPSQDLTWIQTATRARLGLLGVPAHEHMVKWVVAAGC